MKKIILSLAGVMATAAFAPEASALPAFARQTGMACNACHQQHFPVLNKFGQAFKASGYTMMGAQGKVEGEHLSIPDTLNAAMLLKARYVKDDTAPATAADKVSTTGDGQWQIPDEFSLFFGGRVAENIGFMFEGNTANPAGLVAGFKMPVVFEAGGAKLLVIPYLTDALGAGYGFEQSSTGAVRGIRWAEHRLDISAQQYVGIGAGAATGLAFVALNDMGYINVSKWAPMANLANPGAGGTTSNLGSTYVRIAATPTVGDWEMNVGAQFASGTSSQSGVSPAALGDVVQTKASAVDLQAFGQVGENPLALYATYATAPAASVGVVNLFGNDGAKTTTAFTLGADYSVIPNTVHLGAAYRNAKNGAATNDGDNSITLAAIYDLSMNVALHLNHSMRSGSHYQAGVTGKKLTTFLLEAAW